MSWTMNTEQLLPDRSMETAQIFWEGCARREFWLPRCEGCGSFRWYLQEICPQCWTAGAKWERLSGRGTIFSFTVAHRAFHPAFEPWVPFVSIFVEPDEAPGVRFVSRLVDCPREAVRIGMPVEVTFEPIAEDVLLPFFRPSA